VDALAVDTTQETHDDQQIVLTADAAAVGRRIMLARREAGGMTQETLAELLCVCKRSVQAYEAGQRIPYRHLPRLSEVFERPASWFLHGEEDARSGPPDRDDEILERLDLHAQVLKRLAVEVAAVRRTVESSEAGSGRETAAARR
jgi:transcriptional regulator with XRE-family HTH domain